MTLELDPVRKFYERESEWWGREMNEAYPPWEALSDDTKSHWAQVWRDQQEKEENDVRSV